MEKNKKHEVDLKTDVKENNASTNKNQNKSNGPEDWKELQDGLKMELAQNHNTDNMIDITGLLTNLLKGQNDSASPSGLAQIDFRMIKPIMPYENWLPDLFPWSTPESTKNLAWRQHTPVALIDRDWKCLNDCLVQFALNYTQPPTCEMINLQTEIEEIILSVVTVLKQKFKLFSGCKLHHTGSVYEGLKIGKLDEFDFMIELTSLQDLITFSHPGSQKQLLSFVIDDLSFVDDIPILVTPDVSQNKGESKQREEMELDSLEKSGASDADNANGQFIDLSEDIHHCRNRNKTASASEEDEENITDFSIILRSLAIIIEDEIQNHLPQHITLKQNKFLRTPLMVLDFFQHHSAFTYVLEKGDVFVSIDIALAVPIYNLAPLWLGSGGMIKNSMPHDYLEQVKSNHTIHYAIFRSGSTCRISFSFAEKSLINLYSNDSIQKLCLRVVKYLRDNCTTHIASTEKGSKYPILNSYHIKTVFYFMFEKYSSADDWLLKHVAARVLEALLVLQKCFVEKKLESFFIPHYNVLRKMKYISELSDTKDTQIVTDELRSIAQMLIEIEDTKSVPRGCEMLDLFVREKKDKLRKLSDDEYLERIRYDFIFDNCE
ncbi:uncharacterized protein LOC130623664 [Hydractinia symbiolongicarpus]|uniref:uncharacterized protein LOC130623664 n=1 Tax=Hydractinia symbiolongicarpus TaxID=13093 RepID=UPI00254E9F2C|nr:uncharacterized protein LOC130623664 [Hydractinia symbiolongicarpus]